MQRVKRGRGRRQITRSPGLAPLPGKNGQVRENFRGCSNTDRPREQEQIYGKRHVRTDTNANKNRSTALEWRVGSLEPQQWAGRSALAPLEAGEGAGPGPHSLQFRSGTRAPRAQFSAEPLRSGACDSPGAPAPPAVPSRRRSRAPFVVSLAEGMG